tara:strand:- start:6320 stop:6583 length:264 start_codon:yes stop_codon:yes gene_type:complete
MTNKITTLKLETETKQRLEKLREHKRETYDEIIRKMLFILNKARIEPEKAQGILEIIDEKRKRMFEEKKQVEKEKTEKETKSTIKQH